jgi:tetracycline resistance efflux pump
MIGNIYALIPPLIMLILVLLTKKVLLSLGIGIVLGALFISRFDIAETISVIWHSFSQIFVTDEGLYVGNIYLLFFLLFLGVMTSIMVASGGTKAFGDWAIHKIKTRRGAQLFPIILGFIIFIDDYFNSLAVGQVARPLTDRYRISRAKLAYFIDSTSAPITVLAPFSSWGAYIIGIIGTIFVTHQITDFKPFEAFLFMIPMNIYPLLTICLVLIVAIFNINIGPMRKHEKRAMETGEVLDSSKKENVNNLADTFVHTKAGKIRYLIIPIVLLIFATVLAMFITGYYNSGKETDILSMINNMDVNLSLFCGGLISMITSMIFYMPLSKPKTSLINVFSKGINAMLPAIYILILAWMVGTIIEELKIGEYLATIVENSQINVGILPAVIFIVCSFMALATGTSWGTFGIMLPIAASITIHLDPNLLLPSLAAVLSGAVFGDHCSPISDTTILSSTGAGANHIDHVITQLPYAIIVAVLSFIGFIILGITNLIYLSILVPVGLLLISIYFYQKLT